MENSKSTRKIFLQLRRLVVDQMSPFDGLLDKQFYIAKKKALLKAGYSEDFVDDFLRNGSYSRFYGLERNTQQQEAAQVWIEDAVKLQNLISTGETSEDVFSLKELFSLVDAHMQAFATMEGLSVTLGLKELSRDRFDIDYEFPTGSDGSIIVGFRGHFYMMPASFDIWIGYVVDGERKMLLDLNRLTDNSFTVEKAVDIPNKFLWLVEKCTCIVKFFKKELAKIE